MYWLNGRFARSRIRACFRMAGEAFQAATVAFRSAAWGIYLSQFSQPRISVLDTADTFGRDLVSFRVRCMCLDQERTLLDAF